MKTPKREHYCWRCGGPLDVHLDPSGETEEYSICRDCHRKTISHCGHSWEPYKERARWKRKNREARLRNALENQRWKIIRLSAALDFQRRGDKAVKEEYLKHLHIAERAAFYGTYGQDIEGS